MQNLLINDFLLECNKDELRKLKKKELNENDEDGNLADEEEEESDNELEEQEKNYKEQVFNFNEFMKSFANQKILQPYCLAFQKYEKNSQHVNNCIIKIFHRLAFDCQMYCMLFQLSFFRTMQHIFNNHFTNEFYSELVRFSKFIMAKFVEVVKANPKIYIEMLYTKSSKEAYFLEHGHEEVKTKESARRKQKGKKGKDTEFDELSINDDDRFSESEKEPTTEAEKYDKLFGNSNKKKKQKDLLESTRIDLEQNEHTCSKIDENSNDKNEGKSEENEAENSQFLVVDNSISPSKLDETLKKRKKKREKLLELIKDQNSQKLMKSNRKQARTKKRKVTKFDDSDNSDLENETSKDQTKRSNEDKSLNDLEEKKSNKNQRSTKRKPTKFLDSDNSEDEKLDRNVKVQKVLSSDSEDAEEKDQSNEKTKRNKISESDNESDEESIDKVKLNKNKVLASDDKESSNENNSKSKSYSKISDSDNESDEEFRATKLSEKKSMKRKRIDSDSDDNEIEKENLLSN